MIFLYYNINKIKGKYMKHLMIILFLFFSSLNATDYIFKVENKSLINNNISIEIVKDKCPTGFSFNNERCEKLLEELAILSCLTNEWILDSPNKQCSLYNLIDKTTTCPSGYLNYNSTQCYIDQNISASSSCPSGYSGYPCKRTSTATPNQSCPSGYVNRLSSCRKFLGQANVCESGWTYDWDGDCYKSGTGWKAATCASGLISSSYCYSNTDTSSYIDSCSSGWTLSGGTCYKTYTANYVYSCSSGWTLSGSRCLKTSYTNKITDSCPNDYIDQNNGTCEINLIESAIISCNTTDYTYNAETDKCENTILPK
jgi:conjugal transfer mating pair stabilization protein TraN